VAFCLFYVFSAFGFLFLEIDVFRAKHHYSLFHGRAKETFQDQKEAPA